MSAVIALMGFIVVWWALAKPLKTKGKGAFVRHVAGFAGGFVVLCIVAVLDGPEKKDGSAMTMQNATAAIGANKASTTLPLAPVSVKPILSISIIQLSKEYAANEVAADQKYKSTKLRVSGNVQSIDKDMFNNIVVRLKATNEYMSAMASLNSKHEALAASLSKGGKITWECVGGGLIVGSVVLNDCTPI